jgi:hypothetical protein
LQVMILIGAMSATAWAADDAMVGDWKLNPQKSKMVDVMKIGMVGENKYSFDFGGGDPEIAVGDGTDQPGHFGITIALKVDGPDRWTVIRKKDGKLLVTGEWTLSRDGTTLTDHFSSIRADGGMKSVDYLYKRTGGGSGFLSKWVSEGAPEGPPVLLKIRSWEGEGLSFVTQGGGGTRNLKFDGKDYANVGAAVDGQTASAQRVNERTLSATDKFKGSVRDTQEITISADGKTLTLTTHITGRDEPNVQVFERQ